MDILKNLHDELDSRSWAEISKLASLSGVPIHTIAKIKRRETKDPGIVTCQKLIDAIAAQRVSFLSMETESAIANQSL